MGEREPWRLRFGGSGASRDVFDGEAGSSSDAVAASAQPNPKDLSARDRSRGVSRGPPASPSTSRCRRRRGIDGRAPRQRRRCRHRIVARTNNPHHAILTLYDKPFFSVGADTVPQFSCNSTSSSVVEPPPAGFLQIAEILEEIIVRQAEDHRDGLTAALLLLHTELGDDAFGDLRLARRESCCTGSCRSASHTSGRRFPVPAE